jgi:predicted DNA-binding transcriptional regulator YafY
VDPRTVRRDVDRLRELGYPVEATMGAASGYRLVAGTALPPLLLDDEEAVAIAASQPVAGTARTERLPAHPRRADHRCRPLDQACLQARA